MDNVKKILWNVLKKGDMGRKLNEALIFAMYEDIVGEKISRVSKPVFFRGDTLFIGVKNSAWAHQLLFLKPEIIEKINSFLTTPLVRDIRFQIVLFSENNLKSDSEKNFTDDVKMDIPDKNKQMFYNIAAGIQDEKLRNKFIELCIKDLEFKLKRGEIRVPAHRQEYSSQN
ncbi:Protein of unknown function [Caldanaerovirga acetigignens]|uniref:DUF721 domain-containing protein n=1 Tax=Caldanaerovirga acetigignens TaxID=447595 RepID=A0A1M7GQJ8_9FIRM|nr:DUF721 domain-containing protein [Caldanaerovirga acetigignens]SHM18644.1 Protein of unknown function [Caldanaerovirga acetigignens]